MAEYRPTVFADGVTEAQVTNGVARITLVTTGSDGSAVPCATLCLPVAQLPAFVNGMANLLRQIEERVRAQLQQQQQQQQQGAPAAAGADAPPAGGAFRFQS
jgi:hypothetical protein